MQSPTRGAASPLWDPSHLSLAPQGLGQHLPTPKSCAHTPWRFPLVHVWASFVLANAIVRGKQEDQPQPLAVRAPENQCVQLQLMQEPRKCIDSVSSARSCQGLARAPARCVACSVCPVAVLSEHAHLVMHILHITFLFCFTEPCALRVRAACRVISPTSHPSCPALHIVTRVRLAPTFRVCCAHAVVEPSLAMQSRNRFPLPPTSLSRLQACVTTPPSL